MTECLCGCGQSIGQPAKAGRKRSYINLTHNRRHKRELKRIEKDKTEQTAAEQPGAYLGQTAKAPASNKPVVTLNVFPIQVKAIEMLKFPTTEAAWRAVKKEKLPLDLMFGGAKGGSKSVLMCYVNYLYAKLVMNRFQLQPKPKGSEVPHICWMGRKVMTDFVASTMQSWYQRIPESEYELRPASEKHPRHILINNAVAIDYGGLDSQKEVNKFNSAEYGMISLDQAEEVTRDDVSILMLSRRMALKDPKTGKDVHLPLRGLFTCNPRDCWLMEEFIENPDPNKLFLPAKHSDNPRLPAGYVQALEQTLSHRPDMLRALRDGLWDRLSGVDQVILKEWLVAAKTRYRHDAYRKRLVTVDPARFGNDNAVVLGLEGTNLLDADVLPYCTGPQLQTTIMAMAHRIKTDEDPNPLIVVETVGTDSTADILCEAGYNAIAYSPGDRMKEEDCKAGKCFNRRSDAWSWLARCMQSGLYDRKVGAVFTLKEPEDEKLAEIWRNITKQLTWPKYKFKGDFVLIQPKDEIKAEHSNESPDYADAYVQGVYCLDMVTPLYYDETDQVVSRVHRRPASATNRMGF